MTPEQMEVVKDRVKGEVYSYLEGQMLIAEVERLKSNRYELGMDISSPQVERLVAAEAVLSQITHYHGGCHPCVEDEVWGAYQKAKGEGREVSDE